ncbi:MAG: hypothetical protein BGO28_05820 [Alphaproteobacteria bacterium 43-37]|nr:MAG: hypothetical protein BGO28_05820 [Alphaproteobacteria bacterium 43-37]
MLTNKSLDPILAKFAHDMASPLGGVIMALDMIEMTNDIKDSQESIKIIQDSVTKMRVLLTLWRTIFSLSDNMLEEEATFMGAFTDYIASLKCDVKILMANQAAKIWQIRCSGALLLCLNDRLPLIRNGKLSFDHEQLIFQADYERGDLFDRFKKDSASFESLPPTRQALPNYIYSLCDENNIRVEANSSSPFHLKFTLYTA